MMDPITLFVSTVTPPTNTIEAIRTVMEQYKLTVTSVDCTNMIDTIHCTTPFDIDTINDSFQEIHTDGYQQKLIQFSYDQPNVGD